MTLKGDAIFRGKFTGGLKNNIRNLINFHASRKFWKFWKLTLWCGRFVQSIWSFRWKNGEELKMSHDA